MSPVVDVHAHFVPPSLLDDARTGGAVDGLRLEARGSRDWLVARQGHAFPVHTGQHDLDARLAAMDSSGIDRAVVSIAPTLFMYWIDAQEASDWAVAANDALAAQAARSGGRILGTATLPMQDPAAAVDELRRAVVELGFVGAEIAPVSEHAALDDEDVRTVLAAAEDLDVPVILHPYYLGPKPGLEPYYLTNTVGNPLDTTVGAIRLIHGGVLDALPDLRIVLMHGGGYLPYQIGRLDHADAVRREPRHNAEPPSRYLRRFLFDTVTHHHGALWFLGDLVGWDRVAYGTDYPYDMAGGSPQDQLGAMDFDADTAGAVTGGNAAAWFRLT